MNNIRAAGILLFKNVFFFVKMSTRMETMIRRGLNFTTTDVCLLGTFLKVYLYLLRTWSFDF